MKFAIVGDNKHQKPTKGAKGICPLCGETLVARCGNIRMHHWAHPSDSQCPYKENKGEWHIDWQNNFPDDWQEIIMTDSITQERNIADIQTPTGFVLEFQHSHINDEEKIARENFYKNMVWVVDGLNWKKITAFFENKYKTTPEKEPEKFKIPQDDYEINFSVWATSEVPVIYDFYNKQDSEKQEKWREYLYICFPNRDFVGFYIMPVKRQNFIKMAREDRLQKMVCSIQRSIDKKSRQNQKTIEDKERKRQEFLQKQREKEQNKRLITRQNAKPKIAKLQSIFDSISKQHQFVHSFYDSFGTLGAKAKLTKCLKLDFLTDIYNPQYKHNNSNYWIECATNAYLCVDDEDIKNCNIRKFTCCPKDGKSLNEYYKNITKNSVFFTGEIGKCGARKTFSGMPLVVFVDKGSKTISVLCKNIVDDREQNSFSVIHIVCLYGVYYHYQYYSTNHINIFLRMVCNNNQISVSDIKFL